MKEITTATKEELQGAWPDVSYKGKPFFDIFYADLELAEKEIFHPIYNIKDYQEVYVGYIPSTDEFVVGWDVWRNNGDNRKTTCGAEVKLFEFSSRILSLFVKETLYDLEGFEDLFYSFDSGYAAVKASYPDIIDLRLD